MVTRSVSLLCCYVDVFWYVICLLLRYSSVVMLVCCSVDLISGRAVCYWSIFLECMLFILYAFCSKGLILDVFVLMFKVRVRVRTTVDLLEGVSWFRFLVPEKFFLARRLLFMLWSCFDFSFFPLTQSLRKSWYPSDFVSVARLPGLPGEIWLIPGPTSV